MMAPVLPRFDDQLLDGLRFCSMAYSLFEEIRNSADGRSRLRMRATETDKKLIEELLPICRYVQAKYKVGRHIAVRWVHGGQQFDAEIHQHGALVEQGFFASNAYLEVTCVMHPNDYLARELVDSGGVAFGLGGLKRLKNRQIQSRPVIRSGTEFVTSFSQLLLQRIQAKSGIPYPAETSLIVECSLNTLYTACEWDLLVAHVRRDVPRHRFREIFVYDRVTDYSFSLWGDQGLAAQSPETPSP